jgi:hypothetical protein
MRLLFLTLEFSAGTFSGNGQLAKSQAGASALLVLAQQQGAAQTTQPRCACMQVRSLTDLGHEVLVICGTPPGHREPASREGAVDVIQACPPPATLLALCSPSLYSHAPYR